MNQAIALGLYHQGFLTSVQRGSIHGPDLVPTETTPENIATRRLWIGLKFRNALPVLNNMHIISKPSRKIWMCVQELKELADGKKGREMVNGLNIGEVCFIGTDKGVMEIRDAIKNNIGGEVLVRAS